ncbi:hypothetical protein Sgly_1354 [Syntrophobotulus glycolicus DSM 8271]|uniref:Uncharacterized protein n=1 Tax=Syntrophobotulus glycolicus (strain DSM 8271 / FlGlyR) TaxID=645991 RepID=F0SVV3_SYNGF|nr:hypothetical protein [Syntrophobotulus glycolicus]ADY55659.1 hypothetical protein Sgly_1354 [Syntrophobotulus glycolicus DSM 8271]
MISKKKPGSGGPKSTGPSCRAQGIRYEGETAYYRLLVQYPEEQDFLRLACTFSDEDGQILAHVSDSFENLAAIEAELPFPIPENGEPVNINVEIVNSQKQFLSHSDSITCKSSRDLCLVRLQARPGASGENDVYVNQAGETVLDILLAVEAEVSLLPGCKLREITGYELLLTHERLDYAIRYCTPAKRHKVTAADRKASVSFPSVWKNQIPVGLLGGREGTFTLQFRFSAVVEITAADKGESGYRNLRWDSRQPALSEPLAAVTLGWEDDR